MIKKAYVLNNADLAGYLLKNGRRYVFMYDLRYVLSNKPSISLSLPVKKRVFSSPFLFSFFQGLLPEGANKKFHCDMLKIDRNDDFSLLLQLAGSETIGSVTVRGEYDALP